MRIVILCLLIARNCLGTEQFNLTIKEFEQKFHKSYGTLEEEEAAAKNLAAHEAKIKDQNEKFVKGEASFDEAVYSWDDLSDEDFLKQMLGLILPPDDERVNTPEVLAHFDNLHKMYNRQELPDFWDSRDPGLTNSPSGWITQAKNQHSCGSCTAFAINAAAEAALIKAGADLDSMDLSEQWLLNCSPSSTSTSVDGHYVGGNHGCNGAWPDAYGKWLPTRGVLMHEDDYPYTNSANKDDCKDGPYWNPGYKIDNFLHANDCTDKEIKMQIKEYGSVVMTLVVEGGFNHYNSGVFNGCFSGKPPNHSVLAVGWGTLNGLDYWLIKNSWAANFGENGYIKVKRGTCNTNYGCTVVTAVESTVCSKDSPCGTGEGHCPSNDMCQSGSCGSNNCPAIETCPQCYDLLPDADCCEAPVCAYPTWSGDDYCDDSNNNAECNYDGGDCCNNGNDDWNKYCSACECKDPSAITTTELPTTTTSMPELENGGKDCWNVCHTHYPWAGGKCDWCGKDGWCCKKGAIGNGCDGTFGGPFNHQCALKPVSVCLYPTIVGDNYCDDSTNNAECNFDGGDCCNNDNDGWNNYCSACECKDPSEVCEDLPAVNWNDGWGKLCDYVTGNLGWPDCNETWQYCGDNTCGEICKKSCNKC